MAKQDTAVVRTFDGSLADAEGLLAVEQATFAESPYDAPQVRDMLTTGRQRAWLAVGGGQVVGFVIAFPTTGLGGSWWEIDLLAILPEWRGRRLATPLIRAAAEAGAAAAARARAVVADDNQPSLRAFVRAGFRVGAERTHLLIRRFEKPSPEPEPPPGLVIREPAASDEINRWLGDSAWFSLENEMAQDWSNLADWTSLPRARAKWDSRPWWWRATGHDNSLATAPDPLRRPPGLRLLLAEEAGQPVGYAELIEVQTLLYHGLWIESLAAADQRARQALVQAVVTQAGSGGDLDEIGTLVPLGERRLQRALRAGGFRSLGVYRWLSADLPLSGEGEGQHG